MNLDPKKPGVYTLTKSVTLNRKNYTEFIKAGGRINFNGFSVQWVEDAPRN